MADKIPVKANFTGGSVTSLGEFAAGDTVPVANGGTGATTAAGARTNLGVDDAAKFAVTQFAFRNKIINGDMRIDQRNGGAAVTPSAAPGYSVDRFGAELTQASKLTFQQVSDAPAGFSRSLKVTVAAMATLGAADSFGLFQCVEGFNIADFGWGTAGAQSATLSFWVKSSVAGTYCAHMRNVGDALYYIAQYTVNAANTWEYKTITIPGPTTGTWDVTSGRGVLVGFVNLGHGSNFKGNAGTWAAGVKMATAGAVDLVTQAVGSTFQITGAQLEKGSVATPFEHRPYGLELSLCQRYYQRITNDTAGGFYLAVMQAYGPGSVAGLLSALPVQMRSAPTATYTGTLAPFNASGVVQTAFSSITWQATKSHICVGASSGSSGLAAGNAVIVSLSSGGYIELPAEL